MLDVIQRCGLGGSGRIFAASKFTTEFSTAPNRDTVWNSIISTTVGLYLPNSCVFFQLFRGFRWGTKMGQNRTKLKLPDSQLQGFHRHWIGGEQLSPSFFSKDIHIISPLSPSQRPPDSTSKKLPKDSHPQLLTDKNQPPNDSKWPFYPLVGGHLTPWKGHLTIPKRSLWITWQMFIFLSIFWRFFPQP